MTLFNLAKGNEGTCMYVWKWGKGCSLARICARIFKNYTLTFSFIHSLHQWAAVHCELMWDMFRFLKTVGFGHIQIEHFLGTKNIFGLLGAHLNLSEKLRFNVLWWKVLRLRNPLLDNYQESLRFALSGFWEVFSTVHCCVLPLRTLKAFPNSVSEAF